MKSNSFIFFGFMAFFGATGLSRGDVVTVGNLASGQALGISGVVSGGSSTYYLKFANSTSTIGNFNIDSVKIYGSSSSSDTINIKLWTSNGTTATDTGLSFSGTGTTVNSLTTFLTTTITNLSAKTNLSSNYYVLEINNLQNSKWATVADTTNFSLTNSPSGNFIQSPVSFVTSNVGTTAMTSPTYKPLNVEVQFSGASVPEPGTLILGGIAAISGGAGAWWKRRKKKATEQSEAPEETPSV